MKLLRNEQGQMLIMTAIELALLVGFLALAADVGTLFHSKRQMQIAADAAATAGAVNELDGGSAYTGLSDQSVANSAAASNGFTNGQDGVVVTVNSGNAITDGYHKGPGYVEVVISKPDPLYFFKAFAGQNTATVAARAVAGSPGVSQACVYLYQQLYIKGSATISGQNGQSGCGVYVNSDASNAVYNNDGGTTIHTSFLATPGGSAKFQTYPTPTTTLSAPISAPYSDLYQPTPAADCTSANTLTGTAYSGTIPTFSSPDLNIASTSVTCFSAANVSISNATFGPGLYLFEDGLTMSQTVTVNGGTLDIYGGSFNQGSPPATLSLTAPTSGPFNSIGIMQPITNSNEMDLQFGSSTAVLDAYIYAPGAELYLQDQGGDVIASGIVANSLVFNTGTLYLPNYNIVNAATTPNRVVSLVE